MSDFVYLSKYDKKYDTLEYDNFTVQNYNNFFHPNMCHVCKKIDNNLLTFCNQCYMISYCSDAHKLMHYEQHRQFCEHITEYLKEKKGDKWRSLCLLTSKWIQSRYEFLHEVKEQFSRKLQKYEEQMIMFPKSCYLCHRQDNVLTCIKCYSANYCLEHKQDFQEYHSSKCQSLLLFLNLDMKDLCGIKFERKFCPFLDDEKPVDDMHSFIIYYMRNVQESSEPWEVNEYFYSDYISGPLTFYYGMKNANLLSLHMDRDLYIVHVITSNYLERKYIAAWELLLHSLRCTKLTIVLIGLELDNESDDIDVCCLCINSQKKLRFVSRSMLYHNYVNDQSFQRPDFIVRFEADFSNNWSWYENLLSQDKNCPMLLTAASKSVANENINMIDMLFQPISRPRYNVENKFKSIRPWRNLENDFVSYRNAHVTIYENLLPLSPIEPI